MARYFQGAVRLVVPPLQVQATGQALTGQISTSQGLISPVTFRRLIPVTEMRVRADGPQPATTIVKTDRPRRQGRLDLPLRRIRQRARTLVLRRPAAELQHRRRLPVIRRVAVERPREAGDRVPAVVAGRRPVAAEHRIQVRGRTVKQQPWLVEVC